jgi:hypothetical protein
VRAREDPRGRQAAELLERDARVLPASELLEALLDERLGERLVLVQGRPTQ